MGIKTVNPQGLANQQFSILPVDAIPTECPKFSIPESSTQPQEKQRVKPRFFYLDVLQNLLDVFCSQNITVNGGLGNFELVGEQGLGLGQDPTAFTQDASNGSVLKSLALHPFYKGMSVLFGSDGLSVFLEGTVSVNGATLMTGFCKGLEGTEQFGVLSVT